MRHLSPDSRQSAPVTVTVELQLPVVLTLRCALNGDGSAEIHEIDRTIQTQDLSISMLEDLMTSKEREALDLLVAERVRAEMAVLQ